LSKLYVVGIGPGDYGQMTVNAVRVLEGCSIIIGYTVYVDLVCAHFPDKEFITTAMRQEVERCRIAIDKAQSGADVALICSGDAGIYGLAGLVYELLQSGGHGGSIELEVIPGVTAASSGAALLGAPLTNDFSVISLSDLLTPLETIEKRLLFAAESDMCIVLYNPSSKKRSDYLRSACDILLRYRAADTVCGIARNISRADEGCEIMTLEKLREYQADMFTTIFIGNTQTREIDGKMVTPRGYMLKNKS